MPPGGMDLVLRPFSLALVSLILMGLSHQLTHFSVPAESKRGIWQQVCVWGGLQLWPQAI